MMATNLRPPLRFLSAWLANLPAHELLPEAQRLVRELLLIEGVGQKPQAGGQFFNGTLDDAEVLIEFCFSAGRPGRYWGPPEDCHPDEPDDLELIGVLVNGAWVDPSYFSEKQLDRWSEEIVEYQYAAAEDARADAAIEARRDRYIEEQA